MKTELQGDSFFMCTYRKKSVITLIIFFVLISSFIYPDISFGKIQESSSRNSDSCILDNNPLKLHSNGSIVMDADNATVLLSKNANKRFYPASCTKILTAIVVLEKCKNLNEVMKVSDNAVYGIDPTSSHIALESGEKITVEQGLYGLLLCSGNDCAVALAEHIAGSVENFATMMNKKAKELGLENSHFENPHGLFSKTHYTTPADLASIMRYCLQNPKFVKIYSTLKYVIPKTNKSKKRELWNNHKMVKNKFFEYKGVTGGKSGYIDKSRFNLITCATRENMNLIVVNMQCVNPDDILKDTKNELDYFFKNHKTISISTQNIKIGDIKVKNRKINYVLPKEINIIVKKDVSERNLKFLIEKKKLSLPISKGETIGYIKVLSGDKTLGHYSVTSSEKISKSNYFFGNILPWIFFALFILVFFFFIMMRRKYRKRRHKRKNRSRENR